MPENYANLREPHLNREQRQEYVTGLFDDLAPRYDRFNRWVTLFRDEAWRHNTIEFLQDRAGGTVLDLAAGTGDLACSARTLGARRVHVFDISHEMLRCAKQKLARRNGTSSFAFAQGSAHLLPFRDSSMDGVVSGFAMRNVFHFLDQVLAEVHRVLKPGGRFAILELSQPRNRLVRLGFRWHMRTLMPLIGRLTTGRATPFQYLHETTLTFLSPDEFKRRLTEAGFEAVTWKSYLLGGIAIHHGTKHGVSC
ncbi:MAG: ubiquinone/menaquinone biosynthesis methyltransferase [bacterium]